MRSLLLALSSASIIGIGAWYWLKLTKSVSSAGSSSSQAVDKQTIPENQPSTSGGLDYLDFDFKQILFPWSTANNATPASEQPTTKPYPGVGGTMEPTKGIRNNNPLNVEFSDRNPWNGQVGSDGRFAIFESVFYGIRAAARTMKTYRDKHGLKNVTDIVNRWAPPSDNNPTKNYIDFVANKAGVTTTQSLSLADYTRVVAAMIHFENGYNPYELSEISAAVAAGFK